MYDLEALLRALERTFTSATTAEQIMDKLMIALRGFRPAIDPDLPSSYHFAALQANGTIVEHFIQKHALTTHRDKMLLAATPKLDIAPPTADTRTRKIACANHANNCGTSLSTCKGCRMVRYCSQECQKADWKLHKKDCKSNLLLSTWTPQWVRERRDPSFMTSEGHTTQDPFGIPVLLWGNMPATDILNLSKNEGCSTDKDLSLAFIASGDLRNVIRTVNELPQDYSGTLRVLINDWNPIIMQRNWLILAIMGAEEDEDEAAEHALHLWYSVLLPASFIDVRHMIHEKKLYNNPTGSSALTGSTTLHTSMNDGFLGMMLSPSQIARGQISNIVQRVLNSPQRVDYRDRFDCALEPGHRLAFQKWRQEVLLLPFGASRDQLLVPNSTLFSPDMRLYMMDSASPLLGWDVASVIKVGEENGATRQDIIGCLYFYVKSQLKEFALRLKRFKVHITLTSMNPLQLPSAIKSGKLTGLPSDTRFDRIETSNTVDREYVGIGKLLNCWGPLLRSDSGHAAIVSNFMNWIAVMPDADVQNANDTQGHRHVNQAMHKSIKLLPAHLNPRLTPTCMPFLTVATVGSLNMFHDHSKEFAKYLLACHVECPARGFTPRDRHKIVPHRPFAALGALSNGLPVVKTSDDWYRMNGLLNLMHTERYVEWVRT